MKFSRKAVEQALNVNHSQVVWFKQITDGIADEILTAIGRAPKIGRPRWTQLAEFVNQPGNARRAVALVQSDEFRSRSSDDRFAYLLKELAEKKTNAPEQEVWTDPSGRRLASFTYLDAKCTVQIDRRDDPDFAKFLFSKLGDIYRDYSASRKMAE
jgi:ParB family transcriptional regulator, chromosome partitioning protein